jgi:tetratricopeptide (TPR) repeat protein
MADSARTLSRALFGPHSRQYATALPLKANVFNQGRSDPNALVHAERYYREAIAVRRSLSGAQTSTIAHLLDGLGTTLIYQGDYVEADSILREALALKREVLEPKHWGISTTLNNLAGVHLEQGQHEDAIPLLREAVQIRRRIIGEHPDVATALDNLGRSLLESGRKEEAEPILNESLAIYQKTLGPDHNWNAYVLRNLARLNWDRGAYRKCEEVARRALEIDQAAGFDLTNWRIIIDRVWLADGLIGQGRYPEAQDVLTPLADHLSSTSGDELPGALARHQDSVYRRLIDLYEAWGQTDQAAEWSRRRRIADHDGP